MIGKANILMPKDETVDLSLFDIYGNRIEQTTANCYIISEPGQYKFPLVYGNALKGGEVNAEAYTNIAPNSDCVYFVNYNNEIITSPYIETDTGQVVDDVEMSMADTEDMLTDMGIINGEPCKYVRFTVSSVPSVGANAVVSVKNSSGTILWSWHIWLWPHSLVVESLTNSTGVNYHILPVNLATKLDSEDALNSTEGWKNWFYQWGRPTPMLPPASYNSTSSHTNYGVRTMSISSIPAESIGVSIQNPHVFFYNNDDSSSSWIELGAIGCYNMWDASCTTTGSSDNVVVKTIYDPSPIGFHVPNGNTFTFFSINTVFGIFENGYMFLRNESDYSGTFFPASGCIWRGVVDGAGGHGFYWLSSSEGPVGYDYANCLYFLETAIDAQNRNNRDCGQSVRCVME